MFVELLKSCLLRKNILFWRKLNIVHLEKYICMYVCMYVMYMHVHIFMSTYIHTKMYTFI